MACCVLLLLIAVTALAAPEAELIRELKPLSVRGVNYFPRETPWGGMWTKTPAEVWGKNMALAALPLIKELDSNHLTTVGLAFRCDRLKEVGLPDVMQYHEYARKDVFFKEGPKRVLVTFGHQRKVGGLRPLFIGEFGMSTARDEQHGAAPEMRAKMSAATGTEAEQARLYEIVLTGAEQGQAAGALAWCLYDYPINNPNESHFGLVRADGSLKPAASVLREAFSRWKISQ